MKNILHSDYWVEIPAGEFLIGGFSPSQEAQVAARITEQYHRGYYEYWKKRKQEDTGYLMEQKSVHLNLFYICRFPITGAQLEAWQEGCPAINLPGALEDTEILKSEYGDSKDYRHRAVEITSKEAEPLCKELGARLPSNLEWEKSARGIDGRLYPWGDEWDPEAGYFYPGHFDIPYLAGGIVDAFPRGVSSYGVYGLLGYLPQMVGSFSYTLARGCAPKETTPETAWIDNIIPLAHKIGDYVSLRPVLDKWPVQQWQGSDFQKDNL